VRVRERERERVGRGANIEVSRLWIFWPVTQIFNRPPPPSINTFEHACQLVSAMWPTHLDRFVTETGLFGQQEALLS
jgi:hypothetical protein